MQTPQLILSLSAKLIVDLFAGGGGMSEALELAFGRHVDISLNHNPDAMSMHQVNHPQSRHLIADVREVCPIAVCAGRPVGWLHLSPDCTDHSQAKGGQPRDRKIRALSWVGKRWAGQVQPDVISLENVRQILKWGRLIAKRDPATGRVIKLSGGVAERGERVPLENQFLVPDPKRIGETWRRFVHLLRGMGYVVEWKELRAADYGAGTQRKRLFMLARRDGLPIVWPAPTHAANPVRGQKPFVSAAEGIDFGIPSTSIFDRPRPLSPATLRRIALGTKRYVLEAGEPFIVPIANWSNESVHSVREPLRTITALPRGGSMSLVAPVLIQAGYGEREGQAPRVLDIRQPLGVVTAGGTKHALVSAFMAQMNGGFNQRPGYDAREPLSTITTAGSQQQLVSLGLESLSPAHEAGALKVAAFLMQYYGNGGEWGDLRDPLATITTRDRLALVTVHVRGMPYVIVDIQLRMLTPRELFTCQGFKRSYVIERGHDGRIFSKAKQVHMCGNSVSPPPAFAFVSANIPPAERMKVAA